MIEICECAMARLNRPRKKISKKVAKELARGEKTYPLREAIREAEKEVEDFYRDLNENHPTELSLPQLKFAQEFLRNGYNKTNAVRKAYDPEYVSGWSQQEATERGRNFLKHPKVRNYIQQELNNMSERHQVTFDWIAKKYKGWSEIDVAQYVRFVKPKKGRPYLTLKHDLEDLPKQVRNSIRSIGTTAAGDVKVEFIDQRASLDQLAKLLGFANEKLDLALGKGEPIKLVFDKQDEEA